MIGLENLTPNRLDGMHVTLEPLSEAHREGLRAAADDARIWEHTTGIARGTGFDEWLAGAFTLRDAGHEVPFAVRLCRDGRLVGSTRYVDPVPRHKRVEIGATWYHPDVWGSTVNPECKLLLLRHAFEVWGANRVELVTDVLNTRSRAAIAGLGAVFEGVRRAHMIVRNGRVRDSAAFAITRAEWMAVAEGLQARVRAGATP
jgi:RimJ/RimL family protein N-acetyltransferase